nr:MAG TPA: hypothetical protein [Caudoviricetes sp.]
MQSTSFITPASHIICFPPPLPSSEGVPRTVIAPA